MIDKYEDKRIQTPEIFAKGAVVTEGFDAEVYFEVLKGNIAIYVAKNVMNHTDCERIVRAFFQSKHRTQYSVKPVIEKIGTPLYRAGPEHVTTYFKRALQCQQNVNAVYETAGTKNYVEDVLHKIKQFYVKQGGKVRAIQHKGCSGFYGILRSWGSASDQGKDATPIHEDYVQIRLHNGLETQDIIHNNLGSTCFYYSNGKQGGELILYDMRIKIGDHIYEEKNNYGYPDELVKSTKHIIVRPESGDVITFWADRLHKVAGVQGGNRVTAAFFSALKQHTKEIIIWS